MSLNISPALEDYLESVFILQEKGKIVRVKDMARLLNVKAPSVIEALNALKKKELVIHEPYGHIELTQKGKTKAKRLYAKHIVLHNFFHKILGIEKKTAEEDACKIEHYLSPDTTERILAFMDYFERRKTSGSVWVKEFQETLKKKKADNV